MYEPYYDDDDDDDSMFIFIIVAIFIFVGLPVLGLVASIKGDNPNASYSQSDDPAYMKPHILRYNYTVECPLIDESDKWSISYYGDIFHHDTTDSGVTWVMSNSVYDRFDNLVYTFKNVAHIGNNSGCILRLHEDDNIHLINPR